MLSMVFFISLLSLQKMMWSASFVHKDCFASFRDLENNDIAFIEDGTLTVMATFNLL